MIKAEYYSTMECSFKKIVPFDLFKDSFNPMDYPLIKKKEFNAILDIMVENYVFLINGLQVWAIFWSDGSIYELKEKQWIESQYSKLDIDKPNEH